MQAGPAKANDLFAKLAETSDGALKTRERLFAELKAELESHVELEERHLFPVLRKHPDTKDVVSAAAKDNKELRTRLAELDELPKNDGAFLARLTELRKGWRQHARNDAKEILPAVREALSEEQVQGITERMEATLADAEQAKNDEQEQRRAGVRHERERVEMRARQEEAAQLERREQADVQARNEADLEHEQQQVVHRLHEVALDRTQAAVRTAQVVSDGARQVTRIFAESAHRSVTTPLRTGFLFWDMWLGMAGMQPRGSSPKAETQSASGQEQVIPLAEEVLTVGTKKVSAGTTRVRRYVVETPVERQVTLVRERVVVERRRPATDNAGGEMLTELPIETAETDEMPIVGKTVRLKEEVVIRRERTERVQTVRDTLRRDEIEVQHASKRSAR
jgi:uncharacterized protein (TIGR02271 family)